MLFKMEKTKINVKFESGQLLMTTGIEASITNQELFNALNRHFSCDWGELDDEDWKSNNIAVLNNDARILSAYVTDNGIRFWIITEADRSATTALLPREY